MLTEDEFRKQQNWLTMAEIPLILLIAFSVAVFFINAFSFGGNLSGAGWGIAFAAIFQYLWRRMKDRLWAAGCAMAIAVLSVVLGLLCLAIVVAEAAENPNAIVLAGLLILAGVLGLIGSGHHLKFLAARKNRTE